MAETEMVERVARAIYEASSHNKPFDRLSAFQRLARINEARAAIEAMRHLPDHIWELLEDADKEAEWMDSHKAVRHLHDLMIDAALSPPSKE